MSLGWGEGEGGVIGLLPWLFASDASTLRLRATAPQESKLQLTALEEELEVATTAAYQDHRMLSLSS